MIILELRCSYRVVDLISVAGIARSTCYYLVKDLQKPDKYLSTKEMITKIYHEHKGRYGYRRMMLELPNIRFI